MAKNKIKAPIKNSQWTDPLFLLSVILFFILLFISIAYIQKDPPPLSFNVYGPLKIKANGAIALYTEKFKPKSQENNGVVFDSVPVKYTETLSLIALQRKLNLDTLLSVNFITKLQPLKQGQALMIPSKDGLIHLVKRTDSLENLAIKYHITKEQLIATNNLKTEKLTPAQQLFIPNATYKPSQLKALIGDALLFPLVGIVYNVYGNSVHSLTGLQQRNDGIDISTVDGAPVFSAADGIVSDSGFHPTYGYYIVIAHKNNLQTFYGYLDSPSFRRGTKIAQRQVIGHVSNSGISSGGLLHFSVFKDGTDVDPFLYLR